VIAALATVALLTLLGIPAGRALGRRPPPLLAFAESFLLGCGAAGFTLLAFSLAAVPWSRAGVGLALAAVEALLLAIAWRRSSRVRPLPRAGLSPADLLTAAIFGGFSIHALVAPPHEHDFIGIWGQKAKVFWYAGGIDFEWLSHPYQTFTHPDYPVLLPLLYDFHALVGGGWNDRWLGIFAVAFGGAGLIYVRYYLGRETGSPFLASIATLGLASVALPPWVGMAEGPLVACMVAALLIVREGLRSGDDSGFLTAGVLLGIAASVKNEGVTLVVAVAAGLAVARALNARRIAMLSPAVLLIIPWLAVRAVYGLNTDLTGAGMIDRLLWSLGNLDVLIDAASQVRIGHALFWAGIAAAVAFQVRGFLRRERFMAIAVSVQFAFFVAAFLITPQEIYWHFQWAWERLVNQLMVPAGFVAVSLLLPLLEKALTGAAVAADRG
jgi:hypothetical protein